MSKELLRSIFVIIVVISGFLMFNFFYSRPIPANAQELRALLDKVGPIETQEIMLNSGLPFTGETHILVHTIGDYIYDHYGIGGLPYCKDYFLSACYHGFIIDTLGDHGMEGMTEVMEKCNEVGPAVAVQCAHAAGHGFVAWNDYDLLKALKMCDELGDKVRQFGYFNCYDGVFMENMWGVHNGAPSEKRWIKSDDIYYPCNDPRIPEKYIGGCWSNQASLIYHEFYDGNLRKTALACEAVENKPYREICYNNFYRQIHPLTGGDKKKVVELCSTAIGEDRQNECVLTNMVAYWSVGDRQIPYKICDYL
ncbi:MAG: hypothetical protein AAB758_00780, partial [Patescibacteria group bacterium]